jgi:hypothetical protein
MQQSSSEVESHKAGQEIHCLLQNTMVHYCIQNSSPQNTNLSQMTPVDTFTHSYSKIHFIITHLNARVYQKVSGLAL